MMDRRKFITSALKISCGAFLAGLMKPFPLFSQVLSGPTHAGGMPTRPFGKTGFSGTLFGLGGEGVLRTYGREKEAVAVIEKAFEEGVNYMETAPAYSQSQDYYGLVFKNNPEFRRKVFFASKTHDTSYKGAMSLLKDSLKRLGIDYLDLWQLHDLRDREGLEEIFSENGAIRAVEEAKRLGLVRFAGITGHHDPAILKLAAERYDFDSVLVALNAADRHSMSFIENFLPTAIEKKMGIVGMKVYSRGRILQNGFLSREEALGYVGSLPVSHVIIGCDNPAQVEANARLAKAFQPFSSEKMAELERRTRAFDLDLTYYKGR